MNQACLILFVLAFTAAHAQPGHTHKIVRAGTTYKNPIIHADYSDPDAIRVGSDYYLISSSFNHVPGLPILHSRDLVNWTLIHYVLPRLEPSDHYNKVQHGNGVWAPSIRYHKGEFYIYYPDPDFGIYLVKSKHIKGPWSTPVLVEAGKGLIDPCPLWDDDGKLYLVHAFAGSRSGIKSILVVKQLNAAGTRPVSNTVMVYDGHAIDPTVEGPKFYKRNGYYYIFAPAGGVSTGWQIVLRSRSVYGPYERRIVMAKGKSLINGPHQGAWITTTKGEDWFIHFQDKQAFGRVVHLQPTRWINDWPVIGSDADGDGTGEPVNTFRIPITNQPLIPESLAASDEFNQPALSLQWQWQANPIMGWAFPTSNGVLRMPCVNTDSNGNLWLKPHLLLQKFPAQSFTATTKLKFHPLGSQERVGLLVFGSDYSYLSLLNKDDGIYITHNTCLNAGKHTEESENIITKISGQDIFLRVSVDSNALCRFAYSTDGKLFEYAGTSFKAMPGKWVGARIGFFSTGVRKTNDGGYADIDWIRFEK